MNKLTAGQGNAGVIGLNELIEIIEEIVDLEDVPMVPEAILGDDVPIDSADMLRILARLESRYQIHFRSADIFLLVTLDDLLEMVRHKSKENTSV
ncbi:MAG: phosphopantetheine-binding protein [Pseudomonadota bacterium]